MRKGKVTAIAASLAVALAPTASFASAGSTGGLWSWLTSMFGSPTPDANFSIITAQDPPPPPPPASN